MKNFIFYIVFAFNLIAYSQIGIGNTNPNASSILDITSINQGILVPRMSSLERNAITNPANALLIYQTDNISGFYFFNGSQWMPLSSLDNDWVLSSNDMYNANSGNIGVGNIAPSTKFHVTGTTVPGSSGELTTLYSNDFSSGSLNNNLNVGNTCTSTPNIWHISSTSSNAPCNTCTGDRAYIEYDFSCIQNQTLTEGTFTPTTTSINIYFNYGFNDYLNQSLFKVMLYNETTGLTLDTLLNLTADALNTNYTGTHTVVSGNTYSLKFLYLGTNDYGAAVDDILITEIGSAIGGSYVFRLEDGQQQDGYVLTSDVDGNATWKSPSGGGGSGTDSQTLSLSGNNLSISNGNTILLPSGGGGTYTFTNGISESSGTVKLGGNLTQNTTIDMDDNDLILTTSNTAPYPGEFIIKSGNGDIVLETELADQYINFGKGGAYLDADDGTSFLDTGNSSYTIDFAAGFDSGGSGGTAIALGSIEYIVDGTDELFLEASAFSPLDNLGTDLGAGSSFQSGPVRNWDDVYADDFVATSGTVYNRLSERSKFEKRGLKEIMKLIPISYKEATIKIGSRVSNYNERDIKLGFTVENLLKFIPEAVKKSDWVTLEEDKEPIKVIIEKPTGIMYNQIIPVTVKAIQEQQNQIEVLKKEVSELKKILKKLIHKNK